MKIKQFAGGGIVYLPTTNRTTEETSTTTEASSKESTKKPVDKLLDIVKEKGLDSDVAAFTQQVLMKLQMGADPNGEELTQRDLVQLARTASSVATNYDNFEKASQHLTEENAESDIAIDDSGRVYCFNGETNEIKAISIKTIMDNPDNLTPLTNGQLMQYRMSSSSLSFDSKIINDIRAAIGTDTIMKDLQDKIAKFKPTTVEGYSLKQQNQIATGLQAIASGDLQRDLQSVLAAGPNGVYKIKQSTDLEAQNFESTAKYLFDSLSNKAQNKIRVMAAIEGYDPKAMILTMLARNTERSLIPDWEGQLDDEGKLSKTSKKDSPTSEQYKDDSIAARFARGDLQQTRGFISPRAEMAGETGMMAFDAWNGYRPMTDDQKPINTNNVYDIFNNIAQLKGCDQSSITFGNQRISFEDLHGMVLDPEKNVMRMALPFKYDSDGSIVPDFDLLLKYNEVNKFVQLHPGVTKEEIRQKLGEFASQVEIKDDNTINISSDRIKIFGCLGVIASDKLIDIDKDRSKKFLDHIDSDTGDRMIDTFNKYIRFGKADVSKNEAKTPKYNLDKSGKNDLYRGWIYIPITDATQGFGMTQQQLVPREDLMDVTKKDMISQAVQNNTRNNLMITRMQ